MGGRRRSKRRDWQARTTTELTAHADHYAQERLRAYLSTERVDESAADDLLRRAYAAAGLEPPHHIHWLDGPLELLALLIGESPWMSVEEVYRERVPQCAWDDAQLDAEDLARLRGETGGVTVSTDYAIRGLVQQAKVSIRNHLEGAQTNQAIASSDSLRAYGDHGAWSRIAMPLWDAVRERVGERLWFSLGDETHWPLRPWIWNSIWGPLEYSLWHGVRAYLEAPMLAEVCFFDEFFWPNQAAELARFNELVSGYWLGRSVAFVVRKPRLLICDEHGLLHHASGPAVEYADGWGVWAWHGAAAPRNVILHPDELTRDDFLNESNAETRRVIMERMGERFVPEIGGTFIDSSSRGVLYEIELPGDPDRVARYLQMLDPSTGREYYLRVPPDITTAEAAAAWTFGLSAEEYSPLQES